MPEKLSFDDIRVMSSPVNHFLCETLTQDQFGNVRDGIEVSLTINGHQIPFVASLDRIYAIFQSTVKQQATQLAYSAAKIDGLEELRALIERCDYQIRDKIEAAFGVKLDGDS